MTRASKCLVRSPFFQVEKMRLREALHAEVSRESPHIVVAVNGSGIVESQGMEPISFATGDAVVIPACVGEYTVRPQWDLDIMRMSLPAGRSRRAADRTPSVGRREVIFNPPQAARKITSDEIHSSSYLGIGIPQCDN